MALPARKKGRAYQQHGLPGGVGDYFRKLPAGDWERFRHGRSHRTIGGSDPLIAGMNTPQDARVFTYLDRRIVAAGAPMDQVPWTDVDVSAHLPNEADGVLLYFYMSLDWGDALDGRVDIRPYNLAPYANIVMVFASVNIIRNSIEVIIPLKKFVDGSNDQVFQYQCWTNGTPWMHGYSYGIWLYGYQTPITAHRHNIEA